MSLQWYKSKKELKLCIKCFNSFFIAENYFNCFNYFLLLRVSKNDSDTLWKLSTDKVNFQRYNPCVIYEYWRRREFMKYGTLKIEKNLRIGDWKCIYKRKHTWKKGRNNSMEEKNIVDIKEELEEVLNIMQLLEISLTNNEDDEHIIRSLHVLQRMVKSVMDKV